VLQGSISGETPECSNHKILIAALLPRVTAQLDKQKGVVKREGMGTGLISCDPQGSGDSGVPNITRGWASAYVQKRIANLSGRGGDLTRRIAIRVQRRGKEDLLVSSVCLGFIDRGVAGFLFNRERGGKSEIFGTAERNYRYQWGKATPRFSSKECG